MLMNNIMHHFLMSVRRRQDSHLRVYNFIEQGLKKKEDQVDNLRNRNKTQRTPGGDRRMTSQRKGPNPDKAKKKTNIEKHTQQTDPKKI